MGMVDHSNVWGEVERGNVWKQWSIVIYGEK